MTDKVRRFPWKRYLLVFALVVLLFGAPMWSVLIASALADANGCALHEGFINSCIIAGRDWGEDLYTMFVMGWFGMITLPLGLAALALWLCVVVVHAIIHVLAKQRKSAP